MKYHGNYCGPGWSAGKAQDSVISTLPGIDEFDESCREHDREYYLARKGKGRGLKRADLKFAKENMASGNPKRVVAGIAVGIQGLLRSADKIPTRIIKNTNMVSAKEKYVNGAFYKASHPQPKQTPVMVLSKGPKPSKLKKKVKDMNISMPSSYMLNANLKKPTMSNSNGVTVLKHRGLMMTLVGSTTYGVTTEQVNPGKADVFPWASRLARSFDKYRFRKLKFVYRPVCATTQVGVVMMSFDYDTLDSTPVTKAEQSQTLPNIETNAFAPCELKVECDKLWRFTRQGAISTGDLKTYDIGQIVISSAYATASLLGEVYVEYEVELEKPTHGTPLTNYIYSTTSTRAAPFTGATSYGTAQPWSIGSVSTLTCNTPGEYTLFVKYTGTVITAIANLAITSSIPGAAVAICSTSGLFDAAATTGTITYKVRASAGDSLDFTNKTTATTITAIVVNITECEYVQL